MKKYRNTKNKEEIIKYFLKRHKEQARLSTWQRMSDSERLLVPGLHLIDVFPDYGYFVVDNSHKDLKKINSALTSYFLFDDHDCAFKSKLEGSGRSTLSFRIPTEIQTIEKRNFERTQYTLQDKKFTDISLSQKLGNERLNLSSPVLNISRGGACVLITKEVMGIADLTKLVRIRYKSQLKDCAVRNFRIYEKKSITHDEYYAIGLQFLDVLESL
jgi:hypothetical protein